MYARGLEVCYTSRKSGVSAAAIPIYPSCDDSWIPAACCPKKWPGEKLEATVVSAWESQSPFVTARTARFEEVLAPGPHPL